MISRKFAGLLIALATLLISGAPGLAVTVNSTNDPGDGVCDATECTLREAIAAAASEETINFSVTGNITLNPTAGQLTIDKRIVIAGPGAANLTIQRDPAAAQFRIFYVTGSQLVTISDLTIANGNVAGLSTFPENGGGAVFNDGNNLRLTRLVLTGNKAEYGGAIYASGFRDESESDVRITDCTLSMNSADDTGGAIFNDTAGGEARVEILRSTFTGNSAPAGGGAIYNYGREPGDFGALLGITESTFTGNTSNYGSVIYNDGERLAAGSGGGLRVARSSRAPCPETQRYLPARFTTTASTARQNSSSETPPSAATLRTREAQSLTTGSTAI